MEIISSQTVKTKKPHKCWGCTEEFTKGTKMEVVVSVDAGRICRVYWCEKCQSIINTMHWTDTQDGFQFGELREASEFQNYEPKHTRPNDNRKQI